MLQDLGYSENNSQLNKATLQQCYTATVLQELSNSKNNKVIVKQSNAATMLQCNSSTGIKQQEKQ